MNGWFRKLCARGDTWLDTDEGSFLLLGSKISVIILCLIVMIVGVLFIGGAILRWVDPCVAWSAPEKKIGTRLVGKIPMRYEYEDTECLEWQSGRTRRPR